MLEAKPPADIQTEGSRFQGLKLFLIIATAVACGLFLALVVARLFLFPRAFTPVSLDLQERQVLKAKLSRLEHFRGNVAVSPGAFPPPEPYTEKEGSREVAFSARELNGLLAGEPALAHRLAFVLSDNLLSARLLVPIDPDIPLLGGKTLPVTAGLEIASQQGRVAVKLKGVSVWGVPVPNAWLGNLKDVDLVSKFGDDGGFWSTFATGVAEIRIDNNELYLRLKK